MLIESAVESIPIISQYFYVGNEQISRHISAELLKQMDTTVSKINLVCVTELG